MIIGNVQENLTPDMVNHPPHYTHVGIEVADFIEAYKLNWQRGNAVEYICRAGKKDKGKEADDIRKATWYLERDLKRIEKEYNTLRMYAEGMCVDIQHTNP